MAVPGFLQPMVMPFAPRPAERHGSVDLYLPDATPPRPAVVFVHGGPVPADQTPTPRDWPVFQGYASVVATDGVVGAVVDHRLHAATDFPRAADDVAEAVDAVRADRRVDADRVALWFFSAGGLLLADWLRRRPEWLRCVAASYPVLGCPPQYGPRFQPAQAVTEAGDLPIVLTRVGLERPDIAATVEAFVTAARSGGAQLEIVDVPNGHHSFDIVDDTDESRAAVRRAVDRVVGHLT
jgi:acetyl esterase/lipase